MGLHGVLRLLQMALHLTGLRASGGFDDAGDISVATVKFIVQKRDGPLECGGGFHG